MTTKLTLTVESQIIERAKKYAKGTGKSLSAIVESYLDEITSTETTTGNLSPKLKKLIGSVNLPVDFDEEKEKWAYLEKKHF
ncbi:MAG: hypothetical protein RLZZ420_1671 [Bacteroidota bacterium]|jgi:macrodomain Ter protein organizer (MatP/YcbG family)